MCKAVLEDAAAQVLVEVASDKGGQNPSPPDRQHAHGLVGDEALRVLAVTAHTKSFAPCSPFHSTGWHLRSEAGASTRIALTSGLFLG